MGSGKSTLAAQLSGELGASLTSFGDFVRHLALEGGREPARSVLQEIGQRAVDADPRAFVRNFLAWSAVDPARPVVIDGLRHAVVLRELRGWAGGERRPLVTGLVVAPEHERAARLTGGDLDALRRAERHRVETEAAGTLAPLVDFVVRYPWDLTAVLASIRAAAEDGEDAHT